MASFLSLANSVSHPQRIRTGPRTPLNAGHEMPVPLACVIFWLTIPVVSPSRHHETYSFTSRRRRHIARVHWWIQLQLLRPHCVGPSTAHLPYSRAPIAAANVLTAEVPRVPLCYATGQSARVCRGLVIVQESLPTSYIYPKAPQPAFVRRYQCPTYIPGQHSLAPALKSCALCQETISRSGGAGSLDKVRTLLLSVLFSLDRLRLVSDAQSALPAPVSQTRTPPYGACTHIGRCSFDAARHLTRTPRS
ncbi:hypothetical protein DFH08DRAFT_902997 [Mycena albidolilacea]|uniref:Uncharacterized protein n=1 Tax=Mycena albidolilacea TaxID=1033008 RepID=A0AAD6Z3C6_9AGAR|nr:hypothetical protein DFH08DRAFT_902997 [Mycena albidolilacea]